MSNMGILHARLHGRLWHMTHPDRFVAILSSGGIRVEPDIPNSKRWKATRPEHYPFVRHIGGISLFDFFGFDPEIYEKDFPMSNWHSFVPHLSSWGGAVWIEIDRLAVVQSFVSADELRERWDKNGQRQHARMPKIEAANIGNISVSAFRSTFLTWERGTEIRYIDRNDLQGLHAALGEWKAAIASDRNGSE